MTRRIVGVFAHPDDDTYGVAGSLALHAGEDLQVTVVMATSGDAGRIADPWLASRETLGPVREQEELDAWRAIGLQPDVRFLRHGDGHLGDVPRELLVAEILEVLREARPQVVVTFGPEGVTGHEDHVTIGMAATEAFHSARASAEEGAFVRLLHVVVPAGRLERLNRLLRGRGLEPVDPTQPFRPRGVPDASIGVEVDCSAAYDRKLEALRAHKTQAELEDVPFDLWPEVLGLESFVMAWPERGRGAPVLSDLFQDLAPA